MVKKNKLQELIDRGDILANMTKEDAIVYATKMGASDSLRGIAQMGSNLFGFESATQKLKEQDKLFQRILDHEEWGGAAMGAFLTSAVVADTYLLLDGVKKQNQLKTSPSMELWLEECILV